VPAPVATRCRSGRRRRRRAWKRRGCPNDSQRLRVSIPRASGMAGSVHGGDAGAGHKFAGGAGPRGVTKAVVCKR
jgi:hypothetical protein